MAILSVNFNMYKKTSGRLYGIYVPESITSIADTNVTLTATVSGDTTGHTFEWVQISGSPVAWTSSIYGLVATYAVSTFTSRKFRFYVDKGSSKEIYKDIFVNSTPTDETSVQAALPINQSFIFNDTSDYRFQHIALTISKNNDDNYLGIQCIYPLIKKYHIGVLIERWNNGAWEEYIRDIYYADETVHSTGLYNILKGYRYRVSAINFYKPKIKYIESPEVDIVVDSEKDFIGKIDSCNMITPSNLNGSSSFTNNYIKYSLINSNYSDNGDMSNHGSTLNGSSLFTSTLIKYSLLRYDNLDYANMVTPLSINGTGNYQILSIYQAKDLRAANPGGGQIGG